ncbi:MAG: hypothetical protein JO353_00735, partial [Phycisphaerae bacterium]|nr:hypothetical protein [Phycisphaerae bacterium]
MLLLDQHPVPTLLARTRSELSAAFSPGEAWVARTPAMLDVMGGIAEETGSLACTIALDRSAAAVLWQKREDDLLQVFSFDELDQNRPFTLCVPMRSLMGMDELALHRSLAEPGRHWAWSIVGAVRQFRSAGGGMNVAILNAIPAGIGLSSNAALVAASVDAFTAETTDVIARAQHSRQIEQMTLGHCHPLSAYIAGASGAVQVFQSDTCTLSVPIEVPVGMRFVAITIGVSRPGWDERLQIVRTAAVMAHALILKKMRDLGTAAGRAMLADPMGGFLARLDSNDYKRWFRPYLPDVLRGDKFDEAAGDDRPADLHVEPDVDYPVRGVADHHVLEAL